MKRMKSEIKAIKPKMETSKNSTGSRKSCRSGRHNSGYSTKNNNFTKNQSGGSFSNYNNNQNNFNSGNNKNGGRKNYPQMGKGK